MDTAVALGTFDGVHIGHRKVLSLPQNYKKAAVIFAQSPKSVMSGKSEALMTYTDKCSALKEIGIDEIITLNFSEVKDMTPKDFLKFIKEKLKPALISCGFNYHFGKSAAGDTGLLGDFCLKNNIVFNCCEPIYHNGQPVSSTKIREYIKSGEINRANELMYRDFSFTEEVINGDRRGRTLGFPTINQKYPDELAVLKFGVYKSEVCFNGQKYTGITNIGVRPTFLSDYIISETYIDGFSGDLYGESVTVKPQKFMRGEVKFSSADELKQQISRDLAAIK